MPVSKLGLHHLSLRQKCSKLEPYPHPNRMMRVLDSMIYFVAVITPVMTIPQIAKIWVDQNVSGISVITWSTYLLATVFWLLYGIVHRAKPIIFSNGIWVVIHAIIITGVVLYR